MKNPSLIASDLNPLLISNRRAKLLVYGFIFTFVACTSFIAFNPLSINFSSVWFSASSFKASLALYKSQEREKGISERRRESQRGAMSLLWEKSEGWRWLVRRTRDSRRFFFGFSTVCGVIPGIIGYGVMQVANSRNDQLEAHLRKNARP